MTARAYLLPLSLCLCIFVQAQGTRQIIPEEFVKARPGKSSGTKRPLYQPVGAKSAAAKGAKANAAEAAQLGLTIWRLRPSTVADTGVRISVQHESATNDWTPERITSTTTLRSGERIRFSFEAPQKGYLYVIDREQYADGSTGQPSLIFPTTRTRNGDNAVAPGRLIEIPAQDDRPNYMTMRQSRPDLTGELLTVIVAPKPLEGVAIGAQALRLTEAQVKQWEEQWGARVEHFEMTGGAGKPWTKAEQEAGADATRELTQDDPGPQTIYRVAVKPGAPLLVKVGLRYRRETKTAAR